ncbi:MAG: hypothetical protein ACKOXP_10090 [Flavobacteriales bacterium]
MRYVGATNSVTVSPSTTPFQTITVDGQFRCTTAASTSVVVSPAPVAGFT